MTCFERFHRDEQGTISIVAVFAVLLLTILLGMVMNVGRQVDGKVRLQNAADEAAYSGGVTMARAMNTLTFSNHLLCDVFALTAYMREARDRNSESCTPAVLAAWQQIGPVFQGSGFPKFQNLGAAIVEKVPLERELVRTYSEWAAAVSQQVLPMLETILAEELIPQYQRAVVEAFPDIAQAAVAEASRRNGEPDQGRGMIRGALWRTSGELVGGGGEPAGRVLPVVDPVLHAGPGRRAYKDAARSQRAMLSHHYLRDWNNESLAFFDRKGKMSQFGNFWRSFTCGYLEKLLNDEYPHRNLPFQMRARKAANPTREENSDYIEVGTRSAVEVKPDNPTAAEDTEYIESDFTYLATVYWNKAPGIFPKLFTSPMENDSMAYAAVRMYIPRRRLVWWRLGPSGGGGGGVSVGGVPGDFPPLGMGDQNPPRADPNSEERWIVARQSLPTDWTLLNQSWTCQLVPATQECLATVLQTPPSLPAFQSEPVRVPNLGGATSDDIQRISPH